MNKFFREVTYFLSFSIIPLFILITGYLVSDPFKVLYHYSDYSNSHVSLNRDYISTESFINNYPKYHYNSFILGSSRTLAFKPESWKHYLSEDAVPYMFDASCESIEGIYLKLKYLDSLRVPIKNCIVVICRDVSFAQPDSTHHLFIRHPIVSLKSKWDFQWTFFKAYLYPPFLISYYTYKFTKELKPFMSGNLEFRTISYNPITNRLMIVNEENEIIQNPTLYYFKRKNIFYNRPHEINDSISRINEHHVLLLQKIKELFEKNTTSYRVIISPLYEQIHLNANDLKILTEVFGENLYNFSGKNTFTESKYNYYESSHYRPQIGDSIFVKIYKSRLK